jgi:hypothetical protein
MTSALFLISIQWRFYLHRESGGFKPATSWREFTSTSPTWPPTPCYETSYVHLSDFSTEMMSQYLGTHTGITPLPPPPHQGFPPRVFFINQALNISGWWSGGNGTPQPIIVPADVAKRKLWFNLSPGRVTKSPLGNQSPGGGPGGRRGRGGVIITFQV